MTFPPGLSQDKKCKYDSSRKERTVAVSFYPALLLKSQTVSTILYKNCKHGQDRQICTGVYPRLALDFRREFLLGSNHQISCGQT